jgi:DNA-binding transcriptional MocR family regulator
MESPTYWGAILAAQQAGVRIVPLPSGPAGPDPVELARAFEETGARVFDAQANYANPTGAQWPAALRGRAFLVEDDWAHDFGSPPRPRRWPPSTTPGTFSTRVR